MTSTINMKKSITTDSDNESVIETDSIITIEPKPKKKRVMTEAQKDALAIARGKAMIALKAKKAMTDQRKALKKEDVLLRKLELERDVVKHNEYKRKLLIESGVIPDTPKEEVKNQESIPTEETKEEAIEKKVKKTKTKEKESKNEEIIEAPFQKGEAKTDRGYGDTSPDENSDDEMEKLQQKLNEMKLKKQAKQPIKKKKKKVITPPESEESESEEEPEPVKVKKLKKKQEPTSYPPPIAKEEITLKPIVDNEMLKNISLLFPTFK